MLYVIIGHVIETQTVVAGVGRVLLHTVGANTALPTSIVYRGVSRCAYCVSCTVHVRCVSRCTGAPVYRSGGRHRTVSFVYTGNDIRFLVGQYSAVSSALDCVQCSALCPVLWTVSSALDCVQSTALDCVHCSGKQVQANSYRLL